nr:immunoglobulin heavy chain junction region [Macaca mulatta]
CTRLASGNYAIYHFDFW